MGNGSLEFPQISIFGPIRRSMNPGSFQPHTRKCAFCTDIRITFLVSLFPQLPFDVNIAMVQTVWKGSTKFLHIFIFSPIRRCMKPGSLQPHTGKCAFCTDIQITFLGALFPQLSFDIIVALVQIRYRGERKPRISSNFHIRPYLAMHETG